MVGVPALAWCRFDIFVHLLTCDTSLYGKTNKGRNADDS